MPTSTETGLQAPPGGPPKPRCFVFRDGRIYFSRETERQFFFVLTIGMAAAGLAAHFGWLG